LAITAHAMTSSASDEASAVEGLGRL
jgi:hypothetical protein